MVVQTQLSGLRLFRVNTWEDNVICNGAIMYFNRWAQSDVGNNKKRRQKTKYNRCLIPSYNKKKKIENRIWRQQEKCTKTKRTKYAVLQKCWLHNMTCLGNVVPKLPGNTRNTPLIIVFHIKTEIAVVHGANSKVTQSLRPTWQQHETNYLHFFFFLQNLNVTGTVLKTHWNTAVRYSRSQNWGQLRHTCVRQLGFLII